MCGQKTARAHGIPIILIKKKSQDSSSLSGIIGIPIISQVRYGSRLGAGRWSLEISIMQEPSLNSDSDWVALLIFKKLNFGSL